MTFLISGTLSPQMCPLLLTQTWRPRGEPICIEIYSTGRANVSKARNYTDLLESFARMIPELLRYSSSSCGVVDGAPAEVDDLEDAAEEPLLLPMAPLAPPLAVQTVYASQPLPPIVNATDLGTADSRPSDGPISNSSASTSNDCTAVPVGDALRLASDVSFNPMAHRVQWDCESEDDDLYDSIVHNDTTIEPSVEETGVDEKRSRLTFRQRLVQQTTMETPQAVSASCPGMLNRYDSIRNGKRRLYQITSNRPLQATKADGSRRPTAMSADVYDDEYNESNEYKEDSDDPMSGWALGPGMS